MQPDWEIWLDMNVSPIIAKWMADDTGYTVRSSYTLQFNNLSYKEIYDASKEYGNVILISKDADFADLISRLGAPPKLINIQTGNCDNKILWGLLKPRISEFVETLTTSDIHIIELS